MPAKVNAGVMGCDQEIVSACVMAIRVRAVKPEAPYNGADCRCWLNGQGSGLGHLCGRRARALKPEGHVCGTRQQLY